MSSHTPKSISFLIPWLYRVFDEKFQSFFSAFTASFQFVQRPLLEFNVELDL